MQASRNTSYKRNIQQTSRNGFLVPQNSKDVDESTPSSREHESLSMGEAEAPPEYNHAPPSADASHNAHRSTEQHWWLLWVLIFAVAAFVAGRHVGVTAQRR